MELLLLRRCVERLTQKVDALAIRILRAENLVDILPTAPATRRLARLRRRQQVAEQRLLYASLAVVDLESRGQASRRLAELPPHEVV